MVCSATAMKTPRCVPYTCAQQLAVLHGCTTAAGYHQLRRQLAPRVHLPRNPDKYYGCKRRGLTWVSWRVFLCKPPSRHVEHIQTLSYAQASAYAIRHKAKTRDQWEQLCQKTHMYALAVDPSREYADAWVSWGAFLGRGGV